MKHMISIAAMLPLILTSCILDKEVADYATNPSAVHISAYVMNSFSKTAVDGDAQSRFSEGDVVTLYNEDASMEFILSGNDWKPMDKYFLVWYQGEEQPPFHAYYPNTDGTSATSFTVPSSQNKPEKLPLADYMVCTVEHPTPNSAGRLVLPMQRQMAKVIVTLTGCTSSMRLQGFKIGSYAGIRNGSVTNEVSMVTPCPQAPEGGRVGDDGTTYTALVAPGPAKASAVFVTVTRNGVALNIKGIPAMTAASVYSYTLDVSTGQLTMVP